MLVFTHVLRAKGKEDLVKMAEASLDRLVRGVPMPEKETEAEVLPPSDQ